MCPLVPGLGLLVLLLSTTEFMGALATSPLRGYAASSPASALIRRTSGADGTEPPPGPTGGGAHPPGGQLPARGSLTSRLRQAVGLPAEPPGLEWRAHHHTAPTGQRHFAPDNLDAILDLHRNLLELRHEAATTAPPGTAGTAPHAAGIDVAPHHWDLDGPHGQALYELHLAGQSVRRALWHEYERHPPWLRRSVHAEVLRRVADTPGRSAEGADTLVLLDVVREFGEPLARDVESARWPPRPPP